MRSLTDEGFEQFTEHIKKNYGVNLQHKKLLVAGRLQGHVIKNNFKSLAEYLEFVLADKTGKEAAILIDKVTTNHTFFMREVEHFDYFRDFVLPGLVESEHKRKDLRIWSAGCSSGEEPYTLAMIIDNFFGEKKGWWDTKLLATDISTKVLEEALSGIYLNERLTSLPTSWRMNYFTRIDNERSEIVDRLKNEVVFRRFNLVEKTFNFKRRFHVIFCRNVMIYFDSRTRKELVERLYEHMEPGGYLFIGHSESLMHMKDKFRFLKHTVYQKV